MSKEEIKKYKGSEIGEIVDTINELTKTYKFEFAGTTPTSTNILDAPNEISIELTKANVNSEVEHEKASIVGIAIIAITITILLSYVKFTADFIGKNIEGIIAFLIIGMAYIALGWMIYQLYRGYKKHLLKIKDLNYLKELLLIYGKLESDKFTDL